jgi:lysophospholipase L1-like esterase
MKNKLGTLTILIFIIIVGLLAFGVAHKMNSNAVSTQRIDPPPAVATTSDASTPGSNTPLAVFIGDFTQGTDDGGDGDKNWTAILATDIQKSTPLRIANTGEGSGYVVRGANPTFADQVRRVVTPDARAVVISGSRNDVVANPNEVTAAARETYKLVQTLAPRAKLIVIGPTWGNFEPSPQVLQTRDAVREAALETNASFVDPIDDKWFTNGETGLVGPDNVHPTDRGNQMIAEYIYPLVVPAVTQDVG